MASYDQQENRWKRRMLPEWPLSTQRQNAQSKNTCTLRHDNKKTFMQTKGEIIQVECKIWSGKIMKKIGYGEISQ